MATPVHSKTGIAKASVLEEIPGVNWWNQRRPENPAHYFHVPRGTSKSILVTFRPNHHKNMVGLGNLWISLISETGLVFSM